MVGQMVVDYQWLQGTQCSLRNSWYKTYIGSNGSTQAITPKPPMEEFVESSWELVLSWLGFGMALPQHCCPFLKAIMRSMHHVQYCSTTWISIWTTTQFDFHKSPMFHVPNFEVKTNAHQGLKVGLCYLLVHIQVLRCNLYSFMPICPKNLTLIDQRPPISSSMF
jgi:hypothetical protein